MDQNRKYRKNKCCCGKEKDKRAKLCSFCYANSNVNNQNEKFCNGCEKLIPIIDFAFRGKKGRRSRCKLCQAKYDKARDEKFPEKRKLANKLYAQKNPEKIRMWSIRHRWKKMGYDPNEIEKFISEHVGGCKICESTNKLVVDHDHTTGKIRGMLCSECNLGLGKFKDDKNLLEKAIKYLECNNL